MRYWISTDLDGTLLDHHTYSYEAASPALSLCKKYCVPVILNTSKTLAETIALHQKLGFDSPLAVENGSALIFPNASGAFEKTVEFGVQREQILAFIERVRVEHDFDLEGFDDWTISEIAKRTGLTDEQAELASKKQYSEPFIWNGSHDEFSQLVRLAEETDLKVLRGGRFFHLQGKTDKAQPLAMIKETLTDEFPNLNQDAELICLGDNNNDVAMLNLADIPICVKSPKGSYPSLTTERQVTFTHGEGPVGWNEAIQEILQGWSHEL